MSDPRAVWSSVTLRQASFCVVLIGQLTCGAHPDDLDMSKMLRNTKIRAAREGMSLSDLIERELKHAVECPSMDEWLERTAEMKPISSKPTATEIIRELRDSR